MSSDARKARKLEGVRSDCRVRGEVRWNVTKGAHVKCASSLTVHQLRRQQGSSSGGASLGILSARANSVQAHADARKLKYTVSESRQSRLMQMQ